MNLLKRYWQIIVLGILALACAFIGYIIWRERPVDYFTIAFLNIGQGDAIYIESPTHNRMLVDGGPPHAILGELQKVMPFYEHTIDTLLITNPDADHFAGFIDVLHTYHVNHIVEPGTHSDTQTYATFEKEITDLKIPKIVARTGMVIHLGSSTDLTILFPDQDVSTWATNDGSIVAKLSYGSTSVMLTGDAPSKTEEYVLSLVGTSTVQSTILKAGHHGSRTSASEPFISAVDPRWAVISAGFHNKYGHPHKETVDLFNRLHIPMLITFERGTIIFHCTMSECTQETEK